MATYSTKQHSTLLKTFGQKMDEIEKDKAKELIFNILLPVRKMNNLIYNLTSEYPEFTENKESLTFLNQLNVFNHNIMKILNDEPIEFPTPPSQESQPTTSATNTPPNSHNNNDSNTNKKTNNPNHKKNNSLNDELGMSLVQLIDLLVLTDIQPIQYDKDLLINLLITNAITNDTVLSDKNKMISILEDCKFPRNRAQFTMEQIERNLSNTKIIHSSSNSNSNANANSNVNTHAQNNNYNHNLHVNVNGNANNNYNHHMNYNFCQETQDAMNLTMMAIEGVFEGQIHVNRGEIGRVYNNNEIETGKLSYMTEKEFTELLGKCHTIKFTKQQCIKIHRAIKMLLNVSVSFRFNIDVGLAIIYLINEDNIFTQRDITIKPDKIIAAFKNHSAKEILEMGKKSFIKILQTQTQIKMGHATKLWSSLKAFIEDSNLDVPPQILIKEHMHKE